LDVADGHYVPTLLFFPDLVRALRKHTEKPFEVHLLAADPIVWLEPFTESGADGFILCHDTIRDMGEALAAVRGTGKYVGISLTIEEPIEVVRPYLRELAVLTIVGTPMGVKGAVGIDPSVPGKIAEARRLIAETGSDCEIEIDGGIRRHTVPAIAAAGADWIVPGSLMFGGEPKEMREWLATL
jgi:ribulose-phosphate 3-epimerase